MKNTIARPIREDSQQTLFGVEPNWKKEWWGMPSYEMGDARPCYRITVNFMTKEDVEEFSRKLGVSVSTRSDSVWFPTQHIDEPKEWAYIDE